MKIHLGCWHRYIPGFVHVDLCDMPHIDHNSCISSLPMFEDNVADLIYSSHNFEYFSRDDAPEVLKEWLRVLKPGGILRIAVPDFDKLLQVYEESKSIDRMLGPLYGHMKVQTDTGVEEIFHKTVYNKDCLTQLLLDSGFSSVEPYDWRETIHKDYDDHSQAYYPHMDKENGILISLNLEATK